MVTHINLSSNQLQRLPPHFSMLQCLEVMHSNPLISLQSGESLCFFVGGTIDQLKDRNINLVYLCDMIEKVFLFVPFQVLEADNNLIENLEGLNHLPRLEEVLLKNNSILSRRGCCRSALRRCGSITGYCISRRCLKSRVNHHNETPPESRKARS